MSLTKKIVLFLLSVFTIVLIAIYILSKYIILDAFLKINIDNARVNNSRVQQAIDNEIQTINSAAADWAPWDETYNFVLGKNENFISENINLNTLNNLGIDYMVYTDKENKPLHYEIIPGAHDEEFNGSLLDSIIKDPVFFQHQGFNTNITGLLGFRNLPLIISSHPIVTNDYQGPIAGSLIFIRIIDDELLKNVADRTQLPIFINKPTDSSSSKGYKNIDNFIIRDDKIIGHLILSDIHQNPILTLQIESPKNTYTQGLKTTTFFMEAIVILSLVTIIFSILFSRFTVINPIKDLTRASIRMARGDLKARTKTNSTDELGLLGKSFNTMAEKVEKLIKEINVSKEREIQKSKEIIKLKDEFVFIAAHELKTPVTIISGFIDIIKKYSDNVVPELKENIEILSGACERLKNLLFDLLEISRAETGTLSINSTPIDINALITQITKEFSEKMGEKKITLKLKLDNKIKNVLADELKLTEVFNNLLTNAIKYNKENGQIEIRTSKKEQSLLVEVTDTGYGIPANEQPKVFSKFFRVISMATRNNEGTGLGLFITRMLVEKMGGSIGFKSEENKGSNFFFTLKIA